MTQTTKNSPLQGALQKLLASAYVTAPISALAQAPRTAPSQVTKLGVTRATWYQRKNAATYRTARKAFTCQQFGCLKKIEPGEQYLDTMERLVWPETKRICSCCAEETV